MSKNIRRLLSGFLLSLLLVLSNSGIFVNADSHYPPGHFETNTSWKDPVKTQQNKVTIWKTFRSWGFTEEATAGIMGNIQQEGNFDPSITQNWISWEQVKKGKWCGIGLVGWSGPYKNGNDDVRNGLWDLSVSMGVPWTSMEANLAYLKWQLLEGGCSANWYKCVGFSSKEEFMKSTDMEKCCLGFFCGFEMGSSKSNPIPHPEYWVKRPGNAKAIYNELKGTDYSDIGDSTENTNKDSGGKYIASDGTYLSDFELEGMPEYSKLYEGYEGLSLASYNSLSDIEKANVSAVGVAISQRNESNIFTFIRTLVVFLGLLLVIYSVLLFVALIFDRVNTFIDINLVAIITFGVLRYTPEKKIGNLKGYATSGRLIVISTVVFIVGLLIISGGLFSVMYKFITFLDNFRF